MITQSHSIAALALFGKSGHTKRNVAAVIGGLIPDLTMFYMVFWERMQGNSFQKIFDELYFSDFWQEIFAVNNSAPLFALIAAIGFVVKRAWVWAFGLAALLHAMIDLPLHNDDGHPHFWPFTNWIYESPVSYWDPDHYGNIAGKVEFLLITCLAAYAFLRLKDLFSRIAIGVLYLSLAAMIIRFSFGFEG